MSLANSIKMQDTRLNLRTLWGYARAVSVFSRSALPELHRENFERLAEYIGCSGSGAPQPNLPAHEVLAMADGYPLAYRHYRSLTSRRVVILVHGAGCFGDQMQVIARHLSRSDLADVYTLDMRGHGLSPGRPGHAVDEPRQMVSDLGNVVDFVVRRHGESAIVLGGHSAGGGLVLAVSRSPLNRLISAYMFLAPFVGLGSPVDRPYFGGWVRLRGLRLRALSVMSALGVTGFNGSTVIDFAPAAQLLDNRYVAGWSFNTTLGFGPGLWREQPVPIDRNIPVLVASGTADQCFVSSLYPQVFRTIAPHAEIHSLSSIGHWDILVDPKTLIAVECWLRDVAPRLQKNCE
ncbi:alpha/beta hydrolase [Burkholderia sp. PU8-34]